MKATFHITGEIYSGTGYANAAQLLDFFAENKDADEYEFIINSPGGLVSEGFAMADAIKNLSGNKPVTTIAFTCMSIATVVFLAGDSDKRLIAENSERMIHNPWIGFAAGDSEDLKKASEDLERIEQKLASYYAKHISKSEEEIRQMMKEETYISAQDAIGMGFASAILDPVENKERLPVFAKAVAYISSKKPENNNSNIMSKVTEALEEIKVKLGISKETQNLVIALANGKNLNVDTEEMKASQGDVVNIDGVSPEDGEYQTAETQQIFVISGGKIAEINDIETEPTFNAKDIEAFAAEIVSHGKARQESFAKELEERFALFVKSEAFAKHQEKVESLEQNLAKAEEKIGELTSIIEGELHEIKSHVISNPQPSEPHTPKGEGKYSHLDPTEVATHEAMEEIQTNWRKKRNN